MKFLKTLKLNVPSSSNHFTYDPLSDAILVSGQSLSIIFKEISQDLSFLKPKETAESKSESLTRPYLCFAPSDDPSIFLSHSHLSLTCTNLSSKYKKFLLNRSFSSGIHYFEVICPVNCAGIVFGAEMNEERKVNLRLYTTTPRVVGVLIDLEHCLFSLYIDGQLKSPVKQERISPGTWTPFIKLKSKGNKENVVIIDPFSSRLSIGMEYEKYLSTRNHLAHKYENVVAVLDLPENAKEEHLGLKDLSQVQQWVISKEKTAKETKIGLMEFKSKEAKEQILKSKNNKYCNELLPFIQKIRDKERMESEDYLGLASYSHIVKSDITSKEELNCMEQIDTLLKSCLYELDKKNSRAYKEAVNKLSEKKVPEIVINKDTLVKVFYLPNTDNLLLINGSLLKLVSKEYGKYKISSGSFYNAPETVDSHIELPLSKTEAICLLKNLDWRYLVEYMKDINYMFIYNFLEALNVSVKTDCLIFVKYIEAKAFADVTMKAISFEKLNKVHKSVVKDKSNIEHLISILCKMEEILWSMIQSLKADNSLRALWSESESRLQSSYFRLLSFQSRLNSLPSEIALAEAGLIRKEDRLVHFEDLSTQLEQSVYELADKENTEKLWKELRNQLPESNLLSGKVTTSVPLHYTLNNFPPLRAPSEIINVQKHAHNPLLLVTCKDETIHIYTSKLKLTLLLSTDTKLSSKDSGEVLGDMHALYCNEKTSSPLVLSTIIRNEEKYYLRIREYKYSDKFLKYALRENESSFIVTLDNSVFHLKEKPQALAHIWRYAVDKGYSMNGFEEGILENGDIKDYLLTDIIPLTLYTGLDKDKLPKFCVVATGNKLPNNHDIEINEYILKNKELVKLNTKTLGLTNSNLKQIQTNDDYLILVYEDGFYLFTKDSFEQRYHHKGNVDAVCLQDQEVIVNKGQDISIYNISEEESKSSNEVSKTFDRDIREEELTLTDMIAYSNTDDNTPIEAEGKENEFSVLCRTDINDNRELTRNTWNIIDSKRSLELEVEMREAKNIESINLELRFSKDELLPEEIERISKVLKSVDKKEKKVEDENETHIPLTVVWSKGAAANDTISVVKMLNDNNKEFKSNYPKPEFIFAHKANKLFSIKKCMVRSTLVEETKHKPIGSGIIFISNRLSDFKDTPYSFETEEEYNGWLEKRRQYKVELQEFEPAGFFQMGPELGLTFTLNVERPCRYIYLKPTAFRKKPSDMKMFAKFPLGIEYFGVTGIVHESSLPSTNVPNNALDISKAKINTSCSIEIQAFVQHSLDKWEILEKVSELQIQGLEIRNKVIKPILDNESIPHIGLCHLMYDGKELHKVITNKYKLKITLGEHWRLKTVSTTIYSNKKMEKRDGLFRDTDSSYLSRCLTEPMLFNRVNKALCQLLSNPNRKCEERMKAMAIINKVIETSTEHAELVKSNIDFDNFIKANVYQANSKVFGLKFIKQFPDFINILHNFALKELAAIPKKLLNPSAVLGLKSILELVIPKAPAQFLQQLTTKLYEINAKYLKLSSEQIFLRTRLEVNDYPLSDVAWKVLEKKEEVAKSLVSKERAPANVRYGWIYMESTGKFIVDCNDLYGLDTAHIYFNRDNTDSLFRFKVSIYGIMNDSSAEQVLIYDKEYLSHIWKQLTSPDYSTNKEELHPLVINFGVFVARYLIVEITFKNTYTSACGKTEEIENYLKKGLMVEVYGTPQEGKALTVPTLNDLLNVEPQKKTTKQIGNSAIYELVQNANGFVDLLKLKTLTKNIEVHAKPKKVEGNLKELQSKLKDQINEYKADKITKGEVLNLIERINNLQRTQYFDVNAIEGTQCTEYLTEICIELANIITEVVENNTELFKTLKQQTAFDILALIKILFKNFVVYNAGTPRKEMLRFIKEILLKEVMEGEWVKIVIELIEEFLGQSQCDYSQASVIDSLESFNLPEGELLSYLSKKLQIPEQKNLALTHNIQEPPFQLLVSSLVLIVKSLQKLPVEDVSAIIHHGITCNYCGGKKPIVGMRYKCGHCLDFNICSNSHCIKQHEEEFMNHILIAIPKPLPYGPSKAPESLKKILLMPMKLNYGQDVHTGIECDHCGVKNFKGVRYLCANCDYFNLCENCYKEQNYVHKKTHVFLRLSLSLLQTEVATPKTLIPHLDPHLYPLKSSQSTEEVKKKSKEEEAPLMLERSLSALAKQPETYEKLDIDQTLQLAYKICIWICQSDTMNEEKKSIVLKLCTELLCILFKLSTIEAVCNLIIENGQLDTIITTYLNIERDKSLRKSLVKLLYGFKDLNLRVYTEGEINDISKEERREYLDKLEEIVPIRVYLCSSLHLILKSLMEGISKKDNGNLEGLLLLLDVYIAILDTITLTKEMLKKYKVIKDKDLDIPQLTRSLSTPLDNKAKIINIYDAKPSLQFVLGLVGLLEQLHSSVLSTINGWEVILKIIVFIDTKKIIEIKLFERLVSLFFLTTQKIQKVIYRQLLNISSKMIKFENMTTLIITVISSMLQNTINTPKEEMVFNICCGWLNILIWGRPAKEKRKKEVSIYVNMETKDSLELLCCVSSFLQRYLNFGFYEGIMGGKHRLAYRGILATQMLKILANAKGKETLAIQELLETSSDKKLVKALNDLMSWLFLNYTKGNSSSPIVRKIEKISKSVKGIFDYVHKNEDLCKELIKNLKSIIEKGDEIISKGVSSGEYQCSLALEIVERSNKVLLKLIKKIMKTTNVAKHFTLDLGGFYFFFKRLKIATKSMIKESQESDLMKSIIPIIENTAETKTSEESPMPSKIREENAAKEMKLIECTGEKNVSSSGNITWYNPHAQRIKAYTKLLNDVAESEIVMVFELKKVIEIKEVKAVFINYWGMDINEHVDISSVIMEIGMNKGSYTYFSTLERVADKSVESNAITVFGSNLYSYTEEGSTEDVIIQKLNSLRSAKAKYVRFIIRPDVKVALSGTAISRQADSKAIGINSFSILGYEVAEPTKIQLCINAKNQEVSYKVLSIFQQRDFSACLKDPANDPMVVSQLKTNFSIFTSSMNPSEFAVESLLITLSRYNLDLCKWIISEVMNSVQMESSLLLLLQLCMTDLEYFGETQGLVLSFILQELKQKMVTKKLLDYINNYMLLLQIGLNLLTKPISLNINENDILFIIEQAIEYWDDIKIRNTLIKLFLCLLKPSKNILSNINASEFVLKYLLSKDDPHYNFISSFTSVFCEKVGRQILEGIIKDLNVDHLDCLKALLNLTLSPSLIKTITEKKLALVAYEKLKDPNDILNPSISKERMDMVRELVKKGVLGNEENEKQLVEMLIRDLEAMKAAKKKTTLMEVILDVMTVQNTVPVCLYNLDPEREQWRPLMAEDTLKKTKKHESFLNTNVLKNEYKILLRNTIKGRFKNEKEFEAVEKMNWQLVFREEGPTKRGSAEFFRKFFERISGKGPFLMIIAGSTQDKSVIAGAFSTSSFPKMPEVLKKSKHITFNATPETLMFHYYGDQLLHFEVNKKIDKFGEINIDNDGCGAIILCNYFLSISFSNSYATSVGCNSGLTCLNAKINYLQYISYVEVAEIWVAESESQPETILSKDLITPITKVLMKEHTWYCSSSPYNTLRSNAILQIPSDITVKELGECVIGKSNLKFKIRETRKAIEDNKKIGVLFEETKDDLAEFILDVDVEMKGDSKEIPCETEYTKVTPIFNLFAKLSDCIPLIDLAMISLDEWNNKELAEISRTYLKEIINFSKLPNFLQLLIGNKKSTQLIFHIIKGIPDTEVNRNKVKWNEIYQDAAAHCYSLVSKIFEDYNNVEVRENALKEGFIISILERVTKLSGEKPRKWEDEPDKKEIKIETKSPSKKIAKKEVRKGVGYSTEVGKIWDVDEYMESKKAKNAQLLALVEIIANFISCERLELDDTFIKNICESSLLPMLEANMEANSLLEMAKEYELASSYLRLFEKFCQREKLVGLLMELDPHYVPKQREPLYKTLSNLNNLSEIFLKCLEKESDIKPKDEKPRKLAREIKNCYKNVKEAIDSIRKAKKGESIQSILALPLPQAYKALLRDLRFGYTNMRDSKGKYNHFYHAQIEKEKTTSQSKLIRLAQELADLSNALPDEHTNAIYIRVDEERIDFMKALVMGASGTPYAHGAFEYDIYSPVNYPNESPKMNLCTTGDGAVRFNPNLYHDGRICLSLLGTWRGTATENWDPNISTILQVLMSIQAIVMSEGVFFNEPGFEGQIGKPEGEKKNEAYSNIVRYCNIKYAMIRQIKNPPKGFEAVIRRHFYIKKKEIMEEVHKWIEYADTREASYTDLVASHNNEWCKRFKQTKTRYKEMLIEAAKELEVMLNSIEPIKELIEEAGGDPSKIVFKEQTVSVFDQSKEAEGIDVEEDTAEEQAKKVAEKANKLNVDDTGVKDRWSRYIGAVGIDAVAKQSKSCVFLSGAGGLGIEIAKNIVLSSCKEFVLHDTALTTNNDLSSQFFLTCNDIGKNRAIASVNRLQQLNYYVKVTASTEPLSSQEDIQAMKLERFAVVILTETDYKIQVAIDEYCRNHKISLVIADIKGTLCKLINDFGNQFEVLDPNDEESKECMIKEITNEENGLVTTITEQRHGFAEGDAIVIKEVKGMEIEGEIVMEGNKTINDTIHIVKYVDPYKFRIGNTMKYSKYIRNGIAKQVKLKRKMKFNKLSEVYEGNDVPYDKNLLALDFGKADDLFVTHVTFKAIDLFKETNKRMPEEWNFKDAEQLLSIVKDIYEKSKKTMTEREIEFVMKASCTAKVSFSPLCAFMGGLAAQEALKAITGKYTPINQVMYYNSQELIPIIESKDIEAIKTKLGLDKNDRYLGVRTLLGEEVFKRLANWKLFMVGVGAIGCELLKNYAMLGFGCEDGKILITDPDVIENSNLNRQFLFKEKHLRKPKSTTAAAIVGQINPTLKGKIIARTDKVDERTENIFNNEFFNELHVVTNALDNVQARRYIDSRCVTNKIPLLESGTLGAKGHVQVIIPYKTESYSSQNDPEETFDIPVCTLKMFPEEPLHCIEWARDKFEKLFTQNPKNLQMFVDNVDFVPQTGQEIKSLEKALKWLEKKPGSFKDCIKYARSKFQKYFVNDVKQLIFTYPLDTKEKDGQPFWILPRRLPHELKFNPTNELHIDYVIAVASLFARVWGMSVPEDIRTQEGKKQYANIAASIPIKEYIPNADKAKRISSEVEEIKEEKVEEEVTEDMKTELMNGMKEKLVELAADNQCIVPENFEKDNDMNFHIDFVYSMANCRSECYGIEKTTWMSVKMKAGRIVPALTTTTAVVAALQTLELIKLVKGLGIEFHRNAFVNLALPYMSLSEPGEAKKIKLTNELTVTLWDRWEVKSSFSESFDEMLKGLKNMYKLEAKDVFKDNKPILLHSMLVNPDEAKEVESILSSSIKDVLELTGNEVYIDLTVTFSLPGDKKLLKGVPVIRLILK